MVHRINKVVTYIQALAQRTSLEKVLEAGTTRSVSSLKTLAQGVTLEVVLEAGDWAREAMFRILTITLRCHLKMGYLHNVNKILLEL